MGGLGVLDPRRFGRALRLRWKWLDWTDKDKSHGLVPQSHVTKDDLALFSASTYVTTVGNGQRTSFWSD